MSFVTELTIFVLAAFVGFEVISKVPATLHTPLMSQTNAIHGIVMLGGLIVAGYADDGLEYVIGFIAIAFGASASFATPIGYQTNTLVMGPGGYQFRDYLRFGGPLNVLMWLAATALIPLFWPG